MNQPKRFKPEIKLFFIVALIAIVISVGGILLFAFLNKSPGIAPIASAQCNQLEHEINALVIQANYCEMDEDCVVSSQAAYIGGCFNLVNKEADVTFIQEKKLQWENLDCGKGRLYETCDPPPQLVKCQENRCVGPYYRSTTIQELKEGPGLFHTRNVLVEGVYRWGFEDSNFDETADSKEYNIWVEIDEEETELENRPDNFAYMHKFLERNEVLTSQAGEGKAKITIYGIFYAFDPNAPMNEVPSRGNFGHLGLWKHQIVADKIVFKSEVEAVTEKTRYSPDEEVTVEIKNNLDKDIWIDGSCGLPFILQQYETGEWKSYEPYPYKKCSRVPYTIERFGETTRSFNLRNTYEYKDFMIKAGKYRFLFRYSFANLNLAGQKAQFFDAFSNEFTIGDTQSSQFNARIVGSYASPGESSKVAVKDNVVFLTDISEGLLAIDVADPTNPKLLDGMKIDGGGAYAVAIQNDASQLLVGGYGNSKIALVDISGVIGETVLGGTNTARTLRLIAQGEAKRSVQSIGLYGSNWYLAIDGPEFEVIPTELNYKENLILRTNLAVDGTFRPGKIIAATPGGHVLSVEPSPTKLLAAQGEKGLAIFSLGQTFPTLQEAVNVGGYAYDVAAYRDVAGIPFREFAYVIASQELIIVDITLAGSPKIKSKLSLAGIGEAIDLVNGIAAVAIGENGVELVNIQDTDNPVSLGVADTPGRARDVALQYDSKDNIYYAYVADDRDDLQIIEIRR